MQFFTILEDRFNVYPKTMQLQKNPKKKAVKKKEPSTTLPTTNTPVKRNLDDLIVDLPRSWSWRLDCDNTFLMTRGASWNDVCLLLQTKTLPFTDFVEPLQMGHCSQGLLKCFTTVVKWNGERKEDGKTPITEHKGTEVTLYVQCNGKHTVFINGEAISEVLENSKLVTFVNAVWSSPDETTMHKMFEETIPNICLRVALYMIVASNNAIVKSARNQVRYYDTDLHDTKKDSKEIVTKLLAICRRFPHFEMSL